MSHSSNTVSSKEILNNVEILKCMYLVVTLKKEILKYKYSFVFRDGLVYLSFFKINILFSGSLETVRSHCVTIKEYIFYLT